MEKNVINNENANANVNENANANANVNENAKNVKKKEDAAKKASEKATLQSILKVAKLIRKERIGVNATIRLIKEAAEDGNEDVQKVMCTLLGLQIYTDEAATVDEIRKAVNEFYPYYITKDNGRKINVKAKAVYYTVPNDTKDKNIVEAVQLVRKGYYTVPVDDYLQILTEAAKARAKGIQQKELQENAIFTDNKLKFVDKDATAYQIENARNNDVYIHNSVNIWKYNGQIGFHI